MNLKETINPVRALYQDFSDLVKREKNFRKAKPRSALLFLTFRCTSRCRSCAMWKRAIPVLDELNFEGWKKVVDELFMNGVEVLELFGGDVFLRKDILFSLIKYIKQLDMIVHMPTNAILLDEETAFHLVDSGIEYIYISVDDVGEKHDKLRGVAENFKCLVNGIELLQRARGNHSSPTLICNTTISRVNIDSLEQVVSFAHNIGFDACALEYVGEITMEHIRSSKVNGSQPDPYFIQQGDSLLLNESQAWRLKYLVPLLVKTYSKSKMNINTLNIDTLSYKNLYEGTVPAKKCYQERNEVTVDPYGNVIGCPFFSKYILGNLCREPLHAIWNNRKHFNFRKLQNSGSLKICNHCIMTVERSYGLKKGLERIYYNRIREKLV